MTPFALAGSPVLALHLFGCGSPPAPPAAEPEPTAEKPAAPEIQPDIAALPELEPPLRGSCTGGPPFVPGRVDGPDGPAWVLSEIEVDGESVPIAQFVDEGELDPDRIPLFWEGCSEWPEASWTLDEDATLTIRRPGFALQLTLEDGPAVIESARGLIRNEPAASDGYVLFSPLVSGTTYLLDQEGRAVHTWKSDYAPAGLYLLDDGSLLRSGRDPDALGFDSGGTTGIIERFAWDGTLLWRYELSEDDRILHHDIEPMPNGNILAIGWEVMTKEEALAAGRPQELVPEQGIWPDFVVELQPLPDNGARIVWEWHALDHLTTDGAANPRKIDITLDPEREPPSDQELEQLKALGYMDPDAEAEDLRSDFLHINAIDYNADRDQIALSVPAFGEIWILSHAMTTELAATRAGDLRFRWGNPRMYGRGDRGDQQLFYQHDVRWIPDGLPGGGHLTVFNNGGGRPDGRNFSELIELKPFDHDHDYPLQDGEPWAAERVWTHAEELPYTFFASFISGAQRLAGGNTFLCQGPQARFQEVDPDGEVVWEYLNPYQGSIKKADGSNPQPLPPDRQRAVFRATKLPPDHPGLAGRALEPLDPQPPLDE